MAWIRLVAASVMRTAPKINTATAPVDLLAIPSCNVKIPTTSSVVDMTISKKLDTLFIVGTLRIGVLLSR